MTNSTFTAVQNSPTANNSSLNLVDPSSSTTYYDIEFVETSGGDLILDGNGGNADPDTQVIINGVPYNFIYEGTGRIPSNKYGNVGTQNAQVTKIIVPDYPTADGKLLKLVFFPQLEPSYDPAANGGLTYEQYLQTNLTNGAVTPNSFSNTTSPSICFEAGTPLLTTDGYKRAADVTVGDVLVLWNGQTAEVIWQDSTDRIWSADAHPAKPVLISRGALSRNVPEQDLMVSPQHHVLLSGPQVQDFTGHTDVLVPAKALVGLSGVRRMWGKRSVTYVHVMCDRHVVLNSAGAPTESLYPGEMAVTSLSPEQASGLKLALAERGLEETSYGPVAAKRLPVRQAEKLVTYLKEKAEAVPA